MLAAVESLLFAGHRQKNYGGGKFHLAQDARALQADCCTAAVVVRSRSGVGNVRVIAVPGIVMAGDEHDPACSLRIGAAQHGIHVCELRRLGNAVHGLLDERIRLYFKAAAAFLE